MIILVNRKEQVMGITAKLLREKGACGPDIAKFKGRWPNGCQVTQKNCEIAFGGELDMSVGWAVERLLSTRACAKYTEICNGSYAEYMRGEITWAKYWKVEIDAFCELAQQST